MHENAIGTIVVESAIAVHCELGPGLLEGVYQTVLAHELRSRGLRVEEQIPISINYRGFRFEEAFRADLIVESKVILELKSVEKVIPAHKKQVQTYLRLTGCKLGYLLNFGEALMKDGITRAVNHLEERQSEHVDRNRAEAQRRGGKNSKRESQRPCVSARDLPVAGLVQRLCAGPASG